jgi:phosphoserine phosphatase
MGEMVKMTVGSMPLTEVIMTRITTLRAMAARVRCQALMRERPASMPCFMVVSLRRPPGPQYICLLLERSGVRAKGRADAKSSPRKLAAFDLDGTLLSGTPSWEMLHEHFGTMEAARRAHADYSSRKITYAQFMRRDLAAWPRPLKRSELLEVLGGYTLRPGAAGVVEDLKLLGYEVAIVSSALDLLVRPVAKRLGIKHYAANKLGFDGRGSFNGRIYPLVEPLRKELVLLGLAQKLGVKLRDTISVGDTSYDISFLKFAGRGFVVDNPKLAKELGLPNLVNLEDLLEHLKVS